MKWIVLPMVLVVPAIFCCTKSTEPENRPPGVPNIVSPVNGATNEAINTSIWWTAAEDPDDDPVTYDVYFGTSSPPPLFESSVVSQRYYPGYLEYNTQYYWKIIAKDNLGNSSETAMWSFTTGQTPPTPLQFSLQVDQEGDGVLLTWESMENIDLILLDTPDTSSIQLDSTATSYADDTPAMTGTYSIYTVHGSDTSAPATASDTPIVSSTDVTIDTTQGFSWNTSTGEGAVYLRDSTNVSLIDIYLYADTVLVQLYLFSGDHAPYNGAKSTGILNMGAFDFFTAPSTGYDSSAAVVAGDYYAIRVTDDYYAKINIVNADSTSITFGYQFQPKRFLRIF
jgi:hypothetical protein